MIFFLLVFLIPAIFLAGMIWLSVRKSDKPWLKPFFSHHDFQKEIMASTAIGLFIVFWTNLFFIFTRNFPSGTNPTTFVEIWLLIFALFSILISLIIRSYNSLVFSIIYSLVYLIVEIVKWSYDSYFFWIKLPETSPTATTNLIPFVSPAATLGVVWILVNLVYFAGKYFSNKKTVARVGNLLRAFMILVNVVILGFLSTSAVFNIGLSTLKGQYFFVSWPISLIVVLLLSTSVLSVLFYKKITLSLDEISLSLIPGWFLILLSLFFNQNLDSQSFYRNANFSWQNVLWNVVATAFYLSYVMFLVYKGQKNNEKWLRVYSIFLLVCVIIGKFIDTSISLGFNGIFLTIFGAMILIIGGVLEFIRRKNNQLN